MTLYSCSYQKFDKNRWANDDPVDYSNRRQMVNDIIGSKMLGNKEPFEVKYFLGEPNWIDTTNSGKVFKMYYSVQSSYGFDIDPKFWKTLEIEVDTNENKVKNIKVIQSVDKRNLIEKIFTN